MSTERTRRRATEAAVDGAQEETEDPWAGDDALARTAPALTAHGSFVSARDARFWLSAAAATSSFSSSSSSSSFRGLHPSHSALDLRATILDASTSDNVNVTDAITSLPSWSSSASGPASSSSARRPSSRRSLGLTIDCDLGAVRVDDDDDDEDLEEDAEAEAGDDAERKAEDATGSEDERAEAKDDGNDDDDDANRRRAPITSPPAPHGGLRVPRTRLQSHHRSTRDRLGSESRTTTTSPPQRRRSPPRRSMPSPPSDAAAAAAAADATAALEVAAEEVYEHQRYQMLLGWGAKGHLLPLDPAKYVRVLAAATDDAQHDDGPGASRLQFEHSPTFPDVRLPRPSPASAPGAKWEWISPWHLEYPRAPASSAAPDAWGGGSTPTADANGENDPDGWCYATSFGQFPMAPVSTSTTASSPATTTMSTMPLAAITEPPMSPSVRGRPRLLVRRRKWIRYRRLRPRTLGSDALEGVGGGPDGGGPTVASAFDDAFLDSMCGWLRKLGHVRKNWKARYFVLQRSILRYYADEACARLKGEVLLFHPAARVHYVDIHVAGGRDHTFAIQIGPEYTLLLQAERLSDRENWMYCIEDALLCRDSYLQDPLRTQDLRDSVARRRKVSSESMLFSLHGGAAAVGVNPGNLFLLHSKAVVLSTRNNPVMMRLMVACDEYLESPETRREIAQFILKYRQKYSGSGGLAAPMARKASLTSSSRASLQEPPRQRRLSSLEADDWDTDDNIASLQDARSLLALRSYRFFLECAINGVMDHVRRLPVVHATIEITSPRRATTAASDATTTSNNNNNNSTAETTDIDWEMVKRAALYKIERQAFIPLQEVIYGLLHATIAPESLASFERNRRYLARQPQGFFEIQASHVSPSEWRSAGALLDTMDNYSLPSEKASILLEVAKCIYDTYSAEHTVDVQMMAADDFLPIFIFLLARSRLRNIIVSRHLISETMISCVVIGETGYYATMFEAAIGYIATFLVPTTTTTTEGRDAGDGAFGHGANRHSC